MARIALRPDLSLALACLGLYVAAAAQIRTSQGTSLAVAYRALAQPAARAANHLFLLLEDVKLGRQNWEETLSQLQTLRAEVDRLARENHLLVSELLTLRQAESVLSAFPSLKDRAVLASVVSRDLLGSHTLTLDRGLAHGVTKDAAVLAAEGVLGRVDAVWETACRVQLLSHPAAAAAATVVGVEGEALLLGGERPRLEGLPPYTAVPKDAPVVTTGSEGIYPPGLPLGFSGEARIESLFTVVPVRLAARPEKAVAVLVIPRRQVSP
ncbi:MAG: rod shape-determining protein MreC [Thermoanaerobaculum sp.]